MNQTTPPTKNDSGLSHPTTRALSVFFDCRQTQLREFASERPLVAER